MFFAYLLVASISLIIFLFFSVVFKRLNLVDRPDKIRKFHKGDIPLSGGVIFS